MKPTAVLQSDEPEGPMPEPAASPLPDAPSHDGSVYGDADEDGAHVRDTEPDVPSMDEEDLKPGDAIGDWRIVRLVDVGGMGEVYEVRSIFGGVHGALKRIRAQLSTRVEPEKRFEAEVRMLATLECPFIVRPLCAGRHRGRPYLVMEWLDGLTLRDFLNQRRDPIPLAKALHYARRICIALCAAHKEGIIHRDLKPENIFMIEKGTLKVLDFGLAKWAGSNRVSTSEQLGGGLCTVHYAAPEQLEGTGVDDRTDVRALALIFFEMVTLRWAFADRPGVLPAKDIARANQLLAEPSSLCKVLPDCPPSLAALIDRALSRDKTKRPHSTEFLAALQAEGEALLATQRTPTDAPGQEEGEDEEAATASALALPSHETSDVRVIKQLRTASLSSDEPPGDPTAAGNPPPPGPPPVKTFKMLRPSDGELEAARRVNVARYAGREQGADDTTGGGRSATLPPEPTMAPQNAGASAPQTAPVTTNVRQAGVWCAPDAAAVATAQRNREPSTRSHDDSAAARASLELASRPTLPWKRAQDVTPSPTSSHRSLSFFEGRGPLGIPIWMAPVLGMALPLIIFLGVKIMQARHLREQASTPAVPTATTEASTPVALTAMAATSAALVPTSTAEASAPAVPTAVPSASVAHQAPSTTAAAPAAHTTAPTRKTPGSTSKRTDPALLEPEPLLMRLKPEPPPVATTGQSKRKPVESGPLMFDKKPLF